MAKLGDLKKDESPAVTNLGRLIARLALDDGLHRRYLDGAASVIAEAGLNAEEERALVDEDWGRIKVLLGPGSKPASGDDSGPQTGSAGGGD